VLRPRSAGLLVRPLVTMRIPDRPPDRARVGRDPMIRSLIWSGAVPASACWRFVQPGRGARSEEPRRSTGYQEVRP